MTAPREPMSGVRIHEAPRRFLVTRLRAHARSLIIQAVTTAHFILLLRGLDARLSGRLLNWLAAHAADGLEG